MDWDNQQVTCPNGKISRNWRERPGSRSTLAIVQVTFRLPDCASCPDRSRCTRSAVNPRDLTFRPRPQSEALHRLCAEQATTAWQDRYTLRAGVEAVFAQASQRCNIHHTRYRGQDRTHLQHVLTAMALNLVRTDAWLNDSPTHDRWISRLSRLKPSAAPAAGRIHQ
nr:transposase [Streptomyces sp. YIM 121038]